MNENTYIVDDTNNMSVINSIDSDEDEDEDELYIERLGSEHHDNNDDDEDDREDEESIETNINKYTIDELITIFSIPFPLKKQSIKSVMDKLYDETDSAKMKTFYNEVAVKLLNYVKEDEPKPMNIHPVIEGYVNPHMKQVINKMICIDSQFRKDIYHPSHDYTNDLSERVSNVISLHLNHVEIPNSWYVFHEDKNNTTLYIEVKYEFKDEKIVVYDKITPEKLILQIESMYIENPQINKDNTILYNIYHKLIIERYQIEKYIDELNDIMITIPKEITIDTSEINIDKYSGEEDIKEILRINTQWNNSKIIREEVSECLERNKSKYNLLENILIEKKQSINEFLAGDSIQTTYMLKQYTFSDINEIKEHISLVNRDVVEEKGITDSYILLIEDIYKRTHTDIQEFNILLQKIKMVNIEIKSKKSILFENEILNLCKDLQKTLDDANKYYDEHFTKSNAITEIQETIALLENKNAKFKKMIGNNISSTEYQKLYNEVKDFFVVEKYGTEFSETYHNIFNSDVNVKETYQYMNNAQHLYLNKIKDIYNHIELLPTDQYQSLWKKLINNEPKLIDEPYSQDKFLERLKSFHDKQHTELDTKTSTVHSFHDDNENKLKDIYKNTKSYLSNNEFTNLHLNEFTNLHLNDYPIITKRIEEYIYVNDDDIKDREQNIQLGSNMFIFQPDIRVNHIRNIILKTSSHIQKFEIKISNGNYLCSSLAQEVENKINNTIQKFINSIADLPDTIKNINKYVTVLYNSIRKTCSIEIVHSNIKEMNITFSNHAIQEEREYLYREKVLGHYLGFSNKQIYNGIKLMYDSIDINKRMVESEELMNTYGTKYIYICIDDFLQNKTTTNIIGLETTRDKLKVPSSYNCDLKDGDYRKLKSGKSSGLTEAKARAIKSIQDDNINSIRTKWKSVDDINVFAKIPVKYSPVYSLYENNEDMVMIQNDTNSINHDITKRDYFGPVELNKVRVYLLDDDGQALNLNNENWSLSLVCKQNYQG